MKPAPDWPMTSWVCERCGLLVRYLRRTGIINPAEAVKLHDLTCKGKRA